MLERNLKNELEKLWERLRSKKRELVDYIDRVTVESFVGIEKLVIDFPFPVTVISGTQGSGKTTVLKVLGTAFNDITKENDIISNKNSRILAIPFDLDKIIKMKLSYNFVNKDSFEIIDVMGHDVPKQTRVKTKKNIFKPANIAEPSDSFHDAGLHKHKSLSPWVIDFCNLLLPFTYENISLIQHNETDEIIFLVNRTKKEKIIYNEFTMSGGERQIVRLAYELSELRDGLVLIDEIENGLHPYTQQMLMLELQRLALTNNLQIVITTHSPAIYECVPKDGRVFLERSNEGIITQEPYRDILQNAFYGRTLDKLNILCEDDSAESMINGVCDVLFPALNLRHNDLIIGRDTGKDEFPSHIKAVSKFQQLDDFLFVLDGDARIDHKKLLDKVEPLRPRVLYLPSDAEPEKWVFSILEENTASCAIAMNVSEKILKEEVRKTIQLYSHSKPKERHKYMVKTLGDNLHKDKNEIIRTISRIETQKAVDLLRDDPMAQKSEMMEFYLQLTQIIEIWRR